MKENFDRFKFALYKEKEMPEFRKWITALAGLTLFAGLASAQVGGAQPGGGTFVCTTTNGSVTPTLRNEGYTEQVGDIVLICQGGTLPPIGTPIPTANFTIFLNTAVTSRLLPTSNVPNASEALLLIDEPGSAASASGAVNETGYGPNQPQIPCGSTLANVGAGLGGCSEFLGTTPAAVTEGITYGVPVTATACSPACAPAANVFQGLVNPGSNQVNFFGIPVVPPGTTGNRVYRITNIRANANFFAPGTNSQVTASISISSGVGITQSTLTVGFVSTGLSASSGVNKPNGGAQGSTGASFAQCTSTSIASTSSAAAVGTLQFVENFPTAFKTRLAGATANQNIPGTIYNSESGFVPAPNPLYTSTSTAFGTSYLPGQADYGTRLKALFNNVPSGVSIYVSTRDVTNSFGFAAGVQAQLVASETASDVPGGGPPLLGQTGSFTPGTNPAVPISQVNLTSAGSGAAVWEIVSTNPAAIDTVQFAVYINFTAAPATNSPAAGAITVTLSYAPTPSSGLFTSTTGPVASSTLPLPRFSDSLDVQKSLATVTLCTTAMLFPYVVNAAGIDTGIAIANTTSDPFGTTLQSGACSFMFYGAAAVTPAVNPFATTTIAPGTTYANMVSTMAPGFTGYMIAQCNFQYAHGFAFISDVGLRNFATIYLPLIFYNGTVLTRNGVGSGEQLNN